MKFEVTKDGFNTVTVAWTDGPVVHEVDDRLNKYRGRNAAWNMVFGGTKYIFIHRKYSDVAYLRALDDLYLALPEPMSGIEKQTEVVRLLSGQPTSDIPGHSRSVREAVLALANAWDMTSSCYKPKPVEPVVGNLLQVLAHDHQ